MLNLNPNMNFRFYRFIFLSLLAIKLSLLSITPSQAESLNESIEVFLNKVYKSWNEHDIEKLFSNYSINFISGDGLEKDELKELTESLWENYPDIKVENQQKSIRSQDQYASVSLIDFFSGTTAEDHEELGSKGNLSALSQGQLFLRKYGDDWKVESDKSHFELVTVHYGDVKKYLDNNQIYFASPEQVNSGDQYTGALYFILPEDIVATATINKELIISPADTVEESFQTINGHKLERLFTANETNHNELISSTVIFTKGILDPKLEGLLFISKRVNIVPKMLIPKKQRRAKHPFAVSKIKKEEEKEKSKEEEKSSEEESKDPAEETEESSGKEN